jgi:hypothetical protein
MKRIATASRLLPVLAAAGLLLGAARTSGAGCLVYSGKDLDGNGTPDLRIIGDALKQTLTIADAGDSVTITADCNNNGRTTDVGDINGVTYTGVETIQLELNGGGDVITYSPSAALNGVSRHLVLVLGSSGNTVNIVDPGGFPLQANTSLEVDIVGGLNRDIVTVDLSGAVVSNSALIVRGDLNTGSDDLIVKLPQLTNALVDFDVDLGQGNNTVDFESSPAVMASTVRFHVDGGDFDSNSDVVNTLFASTLDGASRLDFDANLHRGRDFYQGLVDLANFKLLNSSEALVRVNGGDGQDFLSMSDTGTGGVMTDNGLFHVAFHGGRDNDVLSCDLNGISGSGDVRLRMQGGLQLDTLLSSILLDAASTNNLDFVAQGGRSEDTLYAAVFEMGGTATMGPAGAVILDGGAELDRQCLTGGNAPVQVLMCEPPY